MRQSLFVLLFLGVFLTACRDQSPDDMQKDGNIYSLKVEYAGVVDEVSGKPIQTKAALPVYIKGYLFEGGRCVGVLSQADLGYNSSTGKIQLTYEGSEERTFYLASSPNASEALPEISIGMQESVFLESTTTSTDVLTGKVTLSSSASLLNRSIQLEKTYAKLKLSRASTFDIERIEVHHLSARSYCFQQTPFSASSDTITRVYNTSDFQAANLDITLPPVPESSNVRIIAYGAVLGAKVSLDFDLSQLRRNTQYTLKLEPPGIDPTNRKFLIMAVCGESNAVGYDESPVDLFGEEASVPHIYQLGMRTSVDRDFRHNLKVLPMNFCPQDMYDLRSRFGGTKKPHLPLGKELLKRIPAGYEILFIDVTRPSTCVTYEGCKAMFNGTYVTAKYNYGLGFYDSENMLPAEQGALYYWNKEGVYYKMLVDRVKHALNFNPENKFLGVMWIQGEDDENPAWVQKHHVEFGKLTTSFFDELNSSGYGTRCPQGVADKRMWYNVTTTSYWTRFHLDTYTDWKTWGYGSGQGLFGYYKLWNPDTFVRPPSTAEYTNETNGTGATEIPVPPSHYGNGAYAKVICPMLAECMDQNGGLFNGKAPMNNRYVNKITSNELLNLGGTITDDDVQNGLLIALPLDTPEDITRNLANDKSGVTIMNNGLEASESAFGFPNYKSESRNRNTLKTVRTNSKNLKVQFTGKDESKGWSACCLVRRTANYGEKQQMIFGNGQNAKGPYMAFLTTSTNEKCGPYTEFIASPAMVNKRETCLPGSLHNADRVRSYDEWIHYGVVYNAASKEMRIFMNGEEVESHAFNTPYLVNPVLNNTFYIGSMDNSNLGMDGEISDFFFWNKPITDKVMSKVYVRSYWGYESENH